ncbi:54S ribosomal protein img2 [Drechslerella dactyloides]|uniref:Large ribosomal subunit protein mL49 n=1 Tax=Drechslerella dactyloides TaxID=74499 RepID=A0AAD6ISD8_DREDA|nr:54S ribosomal protein img2 [Drechslerella dactyloides]
MHIQRPTYKILLRWHPAPAISPTLAIDIADNLTVKQASLSPAMNVLRRPRLWQSPIAYLSHGTSRSIATSSRLTSLPSQSPETSAPLSTPTSPPPPPSLPSSANLPYQIPLTKNGNLPVFQEHRSKSGVVTWTTIRRVKGDTGALKADLVKYLGVKPTDVRVKDPAMHVQVWGKRAEKVKEFLRSKGFREEYPLAKMAKEGDKGSV